MNHNVGSLDRIVRAAFGLAMAVCSFVLPLPTLALAALGVTGGVLMLTALSARCPGYWLLGRSTCSLGPGR